MTEKVTDISEALQAKAGRDQRKKWIAIQVNDDGRAEVETSWVPERNTPEPVGGEAFTRGEDGHLRGTFYRGNMRHVLAAIGSAFERL